MQRKTTTRVTVERTTLIDRLTKAKALTIDRAQKKQAKYDADMEYFNRRLKAALIALAEKVNAESSEKALARLRKGYGTRKQHSINVSITAPEKPASPACEVNKIEKMIRVLEASTDETLTIRADDAYAEYL